MMEGRTEMMMSMDSMMWSMSFAWLFVVLLLGLSGAALVKYLFVGIRK